MKSYILKKLISGMNLIIFFSIFLAMIIVISSSSQILAMIDTDGDGIDDSIDNCITIPNPTQFDLDNDGLGNACDTDVDNDSVDNLIDNCPFLVNPSQFDQDQDGLGNKCDLTPLQIFDDVSVESGTDFQHIRSDYFMNLGGGVAAVDFNNDGFIDIYVTNSGGPNALYVNNGDMTFSNIASNAGVDDAGVSNGVCFADYDNDGDKDFFLGNYGTSKLFQNNGDETFTDVTILAGVQDPNPTFRTLGCAWGDYNKDGFLDLIMVRHLHEPDKMLQIPHSNETVKPLFLFRNNGDGTFTNVTLLLGDPTTFASDVRRPGFQPVFVDYDNDGDADIFIVNDFGKDVGPHVLWRNDGPGESSWLFTDVSASSGADQKMFGMGIAIGDYDRNGFFDFYITNVGNSTLISNQNGIFTNNTEAAGVGGGYFRSLDDRDLGWGTIPLDYDNDGNLDIYLIGGYLDADPTRNPREQQNVFFRNNGDGTFMDISIISGIDDSNVGRGGVYADFNNDGCLDIYLVNLGELDGTPGPGKLFLNKCNFQNNWLTFKLTGTLSNNDAIGARIKLVTADGLQIREIASGASHMSQNTHLAHFGLGDSSIAHIAILWPSGQVQTMFNIPANQILSIVEPIP